jgi:hypothetical protein
MVSYSGFPIMAAMFRNIPLLIWKGETKEPYTDDMVAPLRAIYTKIEIKEKPI